MSLRIKTKLPLHWYRFAAVVVIVDQLAKRWATSSLLEGMPKVVWPVLLVPVGWLTSKKPWPLIASASEFVEVVIVPCTVF